MKKIIFATIIGLAFISCSEKDEPENPTARCMDNTLSYEKVDRARVCINNGGVKEWLNPDFPYQPIVFGE